MPSIEPFKALRYNPKKVGSLSRVVTPPYDVISPEGRRAYYKAHPQNFIRVVFGKSRDPYSEARSSLQRWVRSGVLMRDKEAGLYPYEQEYRVKGKIHRRVGLIALVRLDSRIYPHERIFGGPKQDRLQLMRKVNASLDPIFGLVPDSGEGYRRLVRAVCRNQKPVAAFRFQGVRHRLWRVTDPSWIRKFRQALRAKDLIIADGHHRFEAARAFRQERKEKDLSYRSDAPYNFVMFYLSAVGTEEPGLLPTHRLVKVPTALLKQLKGERIPSKGLLVRRLRSLREHGSLGIGLYTGNGAGTLLRPGPKSGFELDVEWLQQQILGKQLGVSAQVSYTQDLDAAYAKVRSGEAQAVFVMQPPRLKDVLRRARAGRRMPRKTTYFYPKLVSGLVGFPFGE